MPGYSILSIAIYKSSLHCQYQECHKTFIKKERLAAKWQRDLSFHKIRYRENSEKKRQSLKRRYDSKKEFVKQYKKNLWKIEHQILHIKNAGYQ